MVGWALLPWLFDLPVGCFGWWFACCGWLSGWLIFLLVGHWVGCLIVRLVECFFGRLDSLNGIILKRGSSGEKQVKRWLVGRLNINIYCCLLVWLSAGIIWSAGSFSACFLRLLDLRYSWVDWMIG